MRVLIFGGAGFMGRPLARSLLASGHEVWIFDDWSVKPAGLPPGDAFMLKSSVSSVAAVRNALSDCCPEIIYFLAAKQGYSSDWSKFARTNVQGAYTLFESLVHVARRGSSQPTRIVLASSQAIYTPGMNVSELSAKRPHSVYGQTKLQQEFAFRFFCRELRIPLVALRYSIVLGEGQSLDSAESGILRNWMRAVSRCQRPEIYGTGHQIRDFVHIDDVTKVNVLAGLAPNREGVFNVAGEAMNVRNMARLFHEHAGGPEPLVTFRESRPGGEFSLTSNSELVKEFFDWETTFGVGTMIKDFVAFAKKDSGIHE